MQHFWLLPINPVPASRPRVTRQGWTYYADPYKRFKKEARTIIQKAVGDAFKPLEGPLHVLAVFIKQRPHSTKLDYPGPDNDNFEKALFDACNGIVWADDKQIVSNRTVKAWANPGEEGRIFLAVSPVDLEDLRKMVNVISVSDM